MENEFKRSLDIENERVRQFKKEVLTSVRKFGEIFFYWSFILVILKLSDIKPDWSWLFVLAPVIVGFILCYIGTSIFIYYIKLAEKRLNETLRKS